MDKDIQRRVRKKRRLTAEELARASVWREGEGTFLTSAYVRRQGRGKRKRRVEAAARAIGLTKFDSVVIASNADPIFNGYVKVLGSRVDRYSIHTPAPRLERHNGEELRVKTRPAYERFPDVDGVVATYPNTEYIELYRDTNGLSSVIWSTRHSATSLIETISAYAGEINEKSEAAVQFSDGGIEIDTADAIVGKLRQNLGKVAFCRIDYSTLSVIWNAEADRDIDSDGNPAEINAQAAIVFSTDRNAPVVAAIQSTATPNVSADAARLLRELRGRIRSQSS